MHKDLKAIGMIEFSSIAVGIEAADQMVKAANVKPLIMKTICPGKYFIVITSDVSAVKSSIDIGLEIAGSAMVDYLVIPNISPTVIEAMSGVCDADIESALGVIETYSVSSAIQAADTAIKTSGVNLLEVRIAMGLGGKAFFTLTGDFSDVEMAVATASKAVAENGMLVRKSVISGVAEEIKPFIL